MIPLAAGVDLLCLQNLTLVYLVSSQLTGRFPEIFLLIKAALRNAHTQVARFWQQIKISLKSSCNTTHKNNCKMSSKITKINKQSSKFRTNNDKVKEVFQTKLALISGRVCRIKSIRTSKARQISWYAPLKIKNLLSKSYLKTTVYSKKSKITKVEFLLCLHNSEEEFYHHQDKQVAILTISLLWKRYVPIIWPKQLVIKLITLPRYSTIILLTWIWSPKRWQAS